MLFYLRDQRIQLVEKGNAIWSGKLAGGKVSGLCQISINHRSPNYEETIYGNFRPNLYQETFCTTNSRGLEFKILVLMWLNIFKGASCVIEICPMCGGVKMHLMDFVVLLLPSQNINHHLEHLIKNICIVSTLDWQNPDWLWTASPT